MELDERLYDADGKYAARYNFRQSPQWLEESIIEGYESFVKNLQLGIPCCSDSVSWMYDFIETGLSLLGYRQAASLVRTDFPASCEAFGQEMRLRHGR